MCGCKKETADSEVEAADIAAAFKQFGADLEKIKPNVTAIDEEVIEWYGNQVDDKIYNMRAIWAERSDDPIKKEIGASYNERMFEYTKSISADGKCYTNYAAGGQNPEEISKYSDVKGIFGSFGRTWSYKFNGIWINVETQYVFNDDKTIGIMLSGAGIY